MDYANLTQGEELNANGLIYDISSLYEYFEKVVDRRHAKGKRYPLAMLFILFLLAKMGGDDQPGGIAEWVAHRWEELLGMKIINREQAPSHMTYRRALQEMVNPAEFKKLLGEYQRRYLKEGKSVVFSMDGNTVRGSIPRGELLGTHLLSIFVPEQGFVLAQVAVDHKENEIVVAPTILKQVNLSGVIVLVDAMHTPRETSAQIMEAGGDYVWIVKDNQSRTRWAIEKLFVHEYALCTWGQTYPRISRSISRWTKGMDGLPTGN